MKTTPDPQPLIGKQDVARWLTISGFWGFVFYLLAYLSMLLSQRRQPVLVNAKTVLVGMILHIFALITSGSFFSAMTSVLRGTSTTQDARKQAATNLLERTVVLQGVSGAIGSIIPFTFSRRCLQMAAKITGQEAFPAGEGAINWHQAQLLMAFFVGVVGTIVARISAWVADDHVKAREEQE